MDLIKSEYTEADIESAFDELPDGRAVVNTELHPTMPVGKIYATKGNGVYWLKKKLGLVDHQHRGADKKLRHLHTSKTLATRYYETTGRNIVREMEQEQLLVQMMFDTAAQIRDPEERFKALEKATAAQSRFNKTWSPYLEQKLGTLQSSQTLEEKLTLEDILEGSDED